MFVLDEDAKTKKLFVKTMDVSSQKNPSLSFYQGLNCPTPQRSHNRLGAGQPKVAMEANVEGGTQFKLKKEMGSMAKHAPPYPSIQPMGGLRRDPIPLPTSRTLSRCLAQGWPGFLLAAARCGSRSRLSLSFLGVCRLASLAATASGTLK